MRGSLIEIAAVVVWKVFDTAEALFEVDDYDEYVHIQSESALRIDEKILTAMHRWANDDLRSLNAQIEFVLRDALRKQRRLAPTNNQKKGEQPR